MAQTTDTSPPDASTRMQDSVLSDDLSFLVARANALSIAAGNAALAVHGLRARSYSVLALVSDDTRPSQRELAEFLRLDPSQIVALVDDLQKRGLVARQIDPNDRRTNVVVATAAGRELFDAARESAQLAERELHGQLSAEQRLQLGTLLKLIAFPS